MPLDQFHKIVFDLAKANVHHGKSERDGYVHEVKGDKMRVVMGYKPDGSPWLSPWLHTFNHRGGTRERLQYQKGQNVRISAIGTDYRQATVAPGPVSKSFPAPAHANSITGDTFQAGKLRISSNRPDQNGGGDGEHFHDIWIAKEDDNPPQHQDQTGPEDQGSGDSSSQQQSSQQQQQQSGGEPAMKIRVSEKGYLTGVVTDGNNKIRFAAHKQGAKLKFSSGSTTHAIFVDESGIWATGPINIKQDSIPDDDK